MVDRSLSYQVSTGRPEKVSQFPFDECIKKARVFLGPERFQTRDRRKLTYYTFKTQAALPMLKI